MKAQISESGLSFVRSDGWTTCPLEKQDRANNIICADAL